LIYFTFRDDTYVVSSIFTCLMIIGGIAAGVRILLEKGPSRYHVSKDQEIPENTRKLRFTKILKKPEGGGERSHRVGSPTGGAGPPLATPAYGEATLAHFCHHPFTYIVVPENLSEGGGSEIDTAASAGWKIPEREKPSGRQESTGEIPSRRGKIVAIVIAIAPDFIGIIIIISITSTFISTITTPSHCNILSGILSNS
jgi:hypothetical protein